MTAPGMDPAALQGHLPGIREALDKHGGGYHTVGDVVRAILAGEAQLWVSPEALIVTEILDEPRDRVLHFWLATGELEAVLAMHQDIIEWGRGRGCNRAALSGRRGWERVLGAEGWNYSYTVLEREINSGEARET